MTQKYDDKLPWYLRSTPFFILALTVSPIAFVLAVLNYRKYEKDVMSLRMWVATLGLTFFILYFLPNNGWKLVVILVLYVYTGLLLIVKAHQK